MADLIELDLVVKQRGLKESISATERLERQITRAAKAVEQNRISQDRYNKVLLAAKREYQTLGVSSQKATAQVRRFADAQRQAARDVNTATDAIKSNIQSQMAATKGSNRFGVVTQQAGYQVSDFIVQVQSGTNAFVAFGQQASQLVGVLPLIAGPLGLTASAAVALSAGLGIAIPLVTAIGAAFTRSSSEAEKAAGGANSFSESLDKARESSYNLRLELELLNSAYKDSTEQAFATAVDKASATVKELETNLKNLANVPFESESNRKIAEEAIKARIKAANQALESAKEELQVYKDQRQEKQDIANEEAVAKKAFLEFFKQEQQIYEGIQAEKIAGIHEEHQQRVKQEEERRQLIEKNITEFFKNEQKITDGLHKQKVDRIIQEQKDETAAREETLRIAKQKITEYYKEQQQLEEDIQAVKIKNILEEAELRDKALKLARLKFKTGSADLSQIPGEGAARDVYQKYLQDLRDAWEKLKNPVRKHTKDVIDNRTAYQKAMMSAQEFADALDNQVLNAVDGVSNAFSDFLAGGLRDFKDFASSIKDMFVRLLADMAAMALKRRILIPIATGMAAGVGSTAAASSMGSFASGTLGASLAGGAAAMGSGFMAGVQGFMGGGISGYGATLSATAANAGVAATIGAAIPAVLAVTAVIGLFTKKTKLLDSGLRTTVEGFDVAIDTFAKTQSSRLFGLLKGRKKTTYTAAEAELSDPLVQAIGDMQQSIVDAAGTLGIGADAFDNFSYQFKLSLKGLTEEEQLQKINEEILKMGDAFASLTGYFSTMNELLAVAQQRYDLTTRLLQLQGNEEELIARYREQERAATHELNQDLLDQIYALEDQQRAVQQLTDAYNEASAVANQAERDLSAANGALAEAERNVQQAANELQRLLDESLDTALAGLERAIDARRDSINQKYDTLISGLETRLDAANEAASRSAEVYSILSGALSGRSVGGITFASRQAARAYIAGGGSDVERLQSAVEVLSEPSRQLFGSFEDYARDFAITSNVLKESKDAAEAQMTADEKTVALLQEQIEQADREREDQLRLLDEQLEAAKLQIEALKGIDTTILSVDEAMKNVRDAMATYEQTQANHVELNTSVLSIGEAITQLASAVNAQAAAQAAAAAAQQAQAAAAAKAAEAQQQLAVAQSGAVTDVNSTAAKMSLDTAAKISAATPASASEQAMLNRFSGGERPDHIQLAIASGYQYDPSVGGYRKFAAGGMHSGGLRLVGEQGPELEVTGPSRIYSNSSTRSMLSNPELVSEIKELRREIAETKAEQRAANVAMVKYNKRTSDQLRTWNAVGLPQERTV